MAKLSDFYIFRQFEEEEGFDFTYGFSFVCIRKCCVKWDCCRNRLPHSGQGYLEKKIVKNCKMERKFSKEFVKRSEYTYGLDSI